MTYYIYALVDPRNNNIKYVGATVNPQNRLSAHRTQFLEANKEKSTWLKQLAHLGISPVFQPLETVENSQEVKDRENFWIEFYSTAGFELFNILPSSYSYRQKPTVVRTKDSVKFDRKVLFPKKMRKYFK